MSLVRYLLLGLIVYLLVRSFMKYSHSDSSLNQEDQPFDNSEEAGKKVSKSIGEYVDYEEVKDEEE